MSDPSRPLVSVLLSTYNNPAFLERAILCYARQTFRDFEVVVADDGSGPETERLVRRLREGRALTLRHVRQEDRGFRLARARNMGMAAARGRYLLFTDQDCLAGPELLAAHVRAARKRRIVQGGRRHFSKRVTESLLSRPPAWIEQFDMRAWSIHHPLEDVLVHSFMRRFGALTGSNLAGYKEDFLSVGGFDEIYSGWGAEDYDLGYRLRKKGMVLAYLGDGPGSVYHLYHSSKRNFVNLNYMRLYLDITMDVLARGRSRFNPSRSRGRRA